MKRLLACTGALLLAAPALAQSPASILDTYSIFSRDHRMGGIEGGPLGGTTAPSRSAAPLFVGTMQEENRIIALLEVPGADHLLRVQPGDIIPWDNSRVLEITRDRLQLSTPTPAARVITLGNNLLNEPQSSLKVLTPGSTMPARTRRPLAVGPGSIR